MKRKILLVLLVICITLTFTPLSGYAEEGKLNLSTNELTLGLAYYDLDDKVCEFEEDSVYVNDDVEITFAESADPNIATVEYYEDEVDIYGKAPGTTEVTITGSNGLKGIVTVHVIAPEITVYKFNSKGNEVAVDSIYHDSFNPEKDTTYLHLEGLVTSVESEDESIVTVKIEDYDIWDGVIYSFEFIPKGVGTTNIVVKDFFGNEKKIPVEFTEKGLDEIKYMPYMSYSLANSWVFDKSEIMEVSLAESEDENITEDVLKTAEISVKGTDVDITGIKGKRERENGVYNGWYRFEVELGRTAKWKEIFQVTLTIGKASFTKDVIVKRYIDSSKLKTSVNDVVWNGKYRKPAITVKYKTTTFKKGVDYNCWYDDNKNVGKATVCVYNADMSPYSFYKEFNFKINPKGTTLSKLVKAKKAITVKWKKQSTKMSKSRITGYQIQLATNSKFTKNKKTVTVSGYSKVSKKITGLKAKKTYYVRIRTYKTVNGKKYYSSWSKSKNAKTL